MANSRGGFFAEAPGSFRDEERIIRSRLKQPRYDFAVA